MLSCRWMNEHWKEIAALLAGTLLLFFLQLWLDGNDGERYLVEQHHVVAIQRENVDESMSIPLVLELEIDGDTKRYDVMVSFVGTHEEQKGEGAGINASTDLLSVAIDEMISTLEENGELLIPLPTKLENGLAVQWKKPTKVENFLLLFLFPMGILFLYRREREIDEKQRVEMQTCIRRGLPAFNDQILLLLHSGLIFHDAFLRIADNYSTRNHLDGFAQIIVNISNEVKNSGKSIFAIMESSKGIVSCREYSRLVNILADYQVKGVDLQEKLESESRLLWESRKNQSLQKGKEMETKLTFPLAMLLLVVVMIAGVPAIMNM